MTLDSKSDRDPVIVSAARTPVGKFMGGLASLPATRLGALAVREAVRRAGIDAAQIDEVLLGQVVTAGAGQAPARQAAIFAGSARFRRRGDAEQSVRLRPGSGDAGRVADQGGRRRRLRGGRHGEHEQRAVPAARRTIGPQVRPHASARRAAARRPVVRARKSKHGRRRRIHRG